MNGEFLWICEHRLYFNFINKHAILIIVNTKKKEKKKECEMNGFCHYFNNYERLRTHDACNSQLWSYIQMIAEYFDSFNHVHASNIWEKYFNYFCYGPFFYQPKIMKWNHLLNVSFVSFLHIFTIFSLFLSILISFNFQFLVIISFLFSSFYVYALFSHLLSSKYIPRS